MKAIHCDDAAKVLGHGTTQMVKRLSREGDLDRVDAPDGETGVFVSRGSLCALVKERAPTWVNVQVWIDECLASDDPSVNGKDAAAFLWVERHELMDVLTKWQARYITWGRNDVRVSRKWLDAQLANRFSVGMVAGLFCVPEAEAWEWLSKGLIVCPLEVHRHLGPTSFLWRPCWGAILTANARPQTPEVISSFANRRHVASPTQLWGTKHTAAELDCNPADIEKMIENEELPCLLTPDGKRRFNPEDVRALLALASK